MFLLFDIFEQLWKTPITITLRFIKSLAIQLLLQVFCNLVNEFKCIQIIIPFYSETNKGDNVFLFRLNVN